MAQYCVTAARHENKNNHVASSFLMWLHDEKKNRWSPIGPKSAKEVVALIVDGHRVVTGKLSDDRKRMNLGSTIEIELRIAKNLTKYCISEMPSF